MKILGYILVFVALTGFQACSSDDNADDLPIGYVDLPQQSRDFIELHFPNVDVTRVEENLIPDEDGTIYEVRLANGFELDFDKDGLWTEVDGNGQKVPDAIIPQPILEYVQANYEPGIFIESIHRKVYGFKIELSNHLELRFNAEGGFLGLD